LQPYAKGSILLGISACRQDRKVPCSYSPRHTMFLRCSAASDSHFDTKRNVECHYSQNIGMNHPNPPEIHDRCWLSAICGAEAKRGLLSMRLSVASSTKCHQVLGSVIAQSTPRLNVMDLKILHSPARLTAPAISPQDFTAKLAIRFRIKPQP